MGKSTISWTHFTFNPWIGCAKVTSACKFCYAEKMSDHYKWATWGVNGTRRITSDVNWKNPIKWNKLATKNGVRYRVFCASLADVFEDHKDLPEARERLWKLIESTPNLDWLLLTKRPENYVKMFPLRWLDVHFPQNIWLGCSIVEQKDYDNMYLHLHDFKQYYNPKVTFVSAEPMLGSINFHLGKPDWLIIGGESGPITKIRQLNLYHVKSTIQNFIGGDACLPLGGVAEGRGGHGKIFFKQLGSILSKTYKLSDAKGEDFSEYPPLLNWLAKREIPYYNTENLQPEPVSPLGEWPKAEGGNGRVES